MKKILVTLLALLTAATLAFAVPALPGPFRHKQPDGSVIVLELHGDEYFHWTTDASGRTVEQDADGFYRPVDPAAFAKRAHAARSARARENARRARWSSYENPPVTNFGVRKILCILAEFQPEKDSQGNTIFSGKYIVSDPQQHFWDMLNKPGYNGYGQSGDGTTGSVRDFYVDNSMEQYKPEFDVYGPVTLDHPESYYDQNGDHLAIIEAIEKMADDINLDDYDAPDDNDDYVDMILFYFPGHNEAERAPSWTIWPHQVSGRWTVNGKSFNHYFCTSELRGSSGTNVASIGTTCHEFGHALGLPDFYDVDYDDNGRNSFTTGAFDLMGSGNYNNNGRTPPALSAVERNMLGWMDYPETISTAGNYTLPGVNTNTAYRIDARQNGEYFILESRGGSKWDSYLNISNASGLVVYHIDKTDNEVANSGLTAAYLWANTNDINSYGGHPCYYIVPANESPSTTKDYPFPGYRSVTSFVPKDWNGNTVGLQLSNIAYSSGTVTFQASTNSSRTIFGHVTDLDGEPVPHTKVVLSRSSYAFEAPARLSTDQTCETDSNGYYSFELADEASEFQIVSVRKDGYVSQANNVLVSGLFNQVDFVMMTLGQVPPATLKKYDETAVSSTRVGPSYTEMAVGIRYKAAELKELGLVGTTFHKISYMVNLKGGESVFVIVDIGGTRSIIDVTQETVSGRFITVDISDQNLVIPAGKNVIFGVGIKDIVASSYPFTFSHVSENCDGSLSLRNFLTTSSGWGTVNFNPPGAFAVSALLSLTADIDFATHGVSYIKLVDGVPQVVPAAGKTVYSVTWYVDDVAVNGAPTAVSALSSGAHTYKAVLQHYDGTSERVYYDIVIE